MTGADGAPELLPAPPAPAWPVRLARAAERSSTLVVTVLAIWSALVVGAVIMVVTTPQTLSAWGNLLSDPGRALTTSWVLVETAYAALFTGSVGDPAAYGHLLAVRTPGAFASAFSPLSETLVATAPLLLGGLSVSLAFRAGLFNIGAQSQLIAGAIVASWVGISLPGLPLAVHMPLALLAGGAGGAVAGWIPGVLRARTGAHEVIVTIMLNYVALNLLVYVLSLPFFLGSQQVNSISRAPARSALLPHLAGASLRVNGGILVALAAAWAVAWLLRRSTLGFRFRMVGASQDAARAAGVDVRRMVVLVMVLAGALAGLAGAIQVLGVDPQLVPSYGGEVGFTAITVALLGRARPGGVVLAALLFGAFQAGGLQMQAATTVPLELVQVIEAVIVFFIAAPALVRAIYRIRTTGTGFRLFSQGWGG
ncbi:MAG TPA: ABC transporter permease [Verrucomicrobiae bacterium]|nr:ABC transporter permease [Verrucomicrobiae bacterium]